jgi:pilus assembly protein Flp/PilA
MNNLLMRTYVWAQIWREDNGQDLIEYALVAALIAFAAVISMKALAVQINTAFTTIGTNLQNAMAGS